VIDWLTATVTLPRWVVWAALLTQPAIWSERFTKLIRTRLPAGDK